MPSAYVSIMSDYMQRQILKCYTCAVFIACVLNLLAVNVSVDVVQYTELVLESIKSKDASVPLV